MLQKPELSADLMGPLAFKPTLFCYVISTGFCCVALDGLRIFSSKKESIYLVLKKVIRESFLLSHLLMCFCDYLLQYSRSRDHHLLF